MALPEELNDDEQALLSELQQEWREMALSTQPADREAAEQALTRAYASRGVAPPSAVVWLGSPLEGALAAALLTGFLELETAGRAARLDPDLAAASDSVAIELASQLPKGAKLRTRGTAHDQILHTLRIDVEGRLQAQVDERVWSQVRHELRAAVAQLLVGLDSWIWWRLIDPLLAGSPDEHSRLWDQLKLCSHGAHDDEPATYAYLERLGISAGASSSALSDLARACGWCWTFEDVAVLTERPALISLDEQGRLHSESGPAIAYRDGFELFAWNGAVGLRPEIATNPDTIGFDDIETEPRFRGLLIKRFSEERYHAESMRRRPALRFVGYTAMPYYPGGAVREPPRRIRVDDLLLSIPYLIRFPPGGPPPAIPSRGVLNSVFRTGKDDAGMSGGCEWEPFELDEAEYAALVRALKRRGNYRALPEPPSWVETLTDWRIWLAEHDGGVPAAEHRRLHAEATAAHQAFLDSWDEAVRERDPLIPVRRFHESTSAARAVEDLKAGRPIGSSDAEMDTEVDRIARAASDARMALSAAERIGDPALVDKWREEFERADAALREIFPDEGQASAAMALAGAIARQRR